MILACQQQYSLHYIEAAPLKGISNLTESPAYFQQVNGIYRKDGALA